MSAALAVALVINGASARFIGAQLSPSSPGPAAFSIGMTLVVPLGNLASQDPTGYPFYSTVGTALTQRFSYSPWKLWGFFIQASFPSFGMDIPAVDRDYEEDVIDGGNEIVSWNIGIRWRGGGSWQQGPYAEAAAGIYRHRLEIVHLVDDTQSGSESSSKKVRESLVFPGDDKGESGWAGGWTGSLGWIIPITPVIAMDVGFSLHMFHAEFRQETIQPVSQENVIVDRWTDRWIGLRLLAVMTFGGRR